MKSRLSRPRTRAVVVQVIAQEVDLLWERSGGRGTGFFESVSRCGIRPDSGKHNSTVCWGDESGWISSVYKSILCSIYIHLPHVPAVPAVPPTDSAEVVGPRSCKKPKPATRSHNNVGIFHNIPYTSWMQQLATARRNNNSWSSLVWWVCTLVTLKRPWDVWDVWSTVSTQSTRLTFNSLWSPWDASPGAHKKNQENLPKSLSSVERHCPRLWWEAIARKYW